MDLVAIRTAVAAAVATTTPTVRTSAIAEDNPSPPIAIVWPGQGAFLTFDYNTETPSALNLTVTVLVSKASDRGGQNALDAYLAGTSIWTAFATNPTLTGLCSYAHFTEARNYGLLQWAGVDYYGVEFAVEVQA